MEKLDRYNIMRFMYGVYHSHRIRYKDYLQAAERKMSRNAISMVWVSSIQAQPPTACFFASCLTAANAPARVFCCFSIFSATSGQDVANCNSCSAIYLEQGSLACGAAAVSVNLDDFF